MRQAQQILPLWDYMRDRIVAAQQGAGLSVQARGKVHNAAWKAIMSPFFQEHIMGMVREDMAALLATFEGGVKQEACAADGGRDEDDEPPPVLQVARKTVGNASGGAAAAVRAAPRQGATGTKAGGAGPSRPRAASAAAAASGSSRRGSRYLGWAVRVDSHRRRTRRGQG